MHNRKILDLDCGRSIDLWPYLQAIDVDQLDTVLVGGTLVEGIGNDFSDVDVYVISNIPRKSKDIEYEGVSRALSRDRSILHQQSDDEVFLVHFPTEHGGIKIDIEFNNRAELSELLKQMRSIHAYASENPILLTKEMPERAKSLIHRCYTGKKFSKRNEFAELFTAADRNKFTYLLYRWNASDFADFLDILGAWKKRELARCVDLARENLVKQMLAHICLLGCTDYKRKWVLNRLANTDIPQPIKDEFLALFRFTDVQSEQSYIRRSLDCVDSIFGETARHFAAHSNPAYPSYEEVVVGLDEKIVKAKSDYERYEAKYRMKAYVGAGQSATATWLDADFK